MTNEVERRTPDRVRLVPTSWSDGRLFFLEATCSGCGQAFPISTVGLGQSPSERERQVRAEFVEHVYSKHRHSY